MGPIDFFRSRIDQFRAHPIQGLIGLGAGAVGSAFGGPAGGQFASALTRRGFDRYNNSQFSGNIGSALDRSLDQTTLDTNDAMNKPLNDDRLGGNTPFGWVGPTGPNSGTDVNGPGFNDSGTRAQQDRQLGDALTGGGGGTYGGGPSYQPYSGPSMSGQQWMDRSGGYGNIIGQTLGLAPDQSPLVNSLLDPISMGPGLPGSGHMNPQARRDYREGTSNVGPGIGNYGVSNFMVGGSPVIFGAGDPNGRYRMRGTQYGG